MQHENKKRERQELKSKRDVLSAVFLTEGPSGLCWAAMIGKVIIGLCRASE